MRIYTLGHSTRTLKEFMELLRDLGVSVLIDVRRWPSSRAYPHFNKDSLEEALPRENIKYVWMGNLLGGYRKGGLGPSSPNKGWRKGGFRNYADYALTSDFRKGLKKILEVVEVETVALMCAEKHYFRCHRRIISDHLSVKGVKVIHIIGRGENVEHVLTKFAVVEEHGIKYPDDSTLHD